MKNKQSLLLLASLAVTSLLASCGSNQPSSGEANIKTVDFITPNDEGEAQKSGIQLHLLFKGSSEIPYICLDEGFSIMSGIKAVRGKDERNQKYYYHITDDGKTATVVDELNAKATFDLANQTIVYDDLENFCSMKPETMLKPLSLLGLDGKAKAIKASKNDFTKAKQTFTIDLKKYDGVDLFAHNGKTYLPLVTFNDAFYGVFESSSIAYNFKDVYLVNDGSLFTNLFGVSIPTPYGESFFNTTKKATISKEIANFNYQESCLMFDHFYGLKKDKGYTSFASFIEQKGFKADFENTNTKKADDALTLTLSHLVDGHTSAVLNSCLYEFGTAENDAKRMNAERQQWMSESEAFQLKRKQTGTAPLGNYYEPTTKTYFIAFDSFTPIDEAVLYSPNIVDNQEVAKTSTAVQFAQAYKYLSSAEGKEKVNTVVIDLATNDGGSSDALVFALSTILGDVKTNCVNPYTDAFNETVYHADLNLDGKIDAEDKGLLEKGYNITILDSRYSFSSGNALPAIAKANSDKVKTLGETSGGGACAVRNSFNGLSSVYCLSSTTQIVTKKGDQYVNVDKGVPADVEVAQDSMFDRLVVGKMANDAFPGLK